MVSHEPTSASISIINKFKKIVTRYGSNIALQALDSNGTLTQTVSYDELDQWSDNICLRLQQEGVKFADKVALETESSTISICTILALLKIGAIYVPIDENYPQKRISFIINDCQIRLGIYFHKNATKLSNTSSLKILHLVLQEFQKNSPHPVELPPTSPDDSLYVMYTSGSTGRPKGVEIKHKGVTRLVSSNNSYCQFDTSTSFLQLAPMTFDASTLEIWGPLLNGGRCVLYSFSDFPDPRIIVQILQKFQINSLWLTASFFNWLIDTEKLSGVTLKHLLIGGEALSVAHVKKAQQALPYTQIINGYGPTETTTFACCYPIPNSLPNDWTSIPIGFPIYQTDTYILNDKLEQVATGQAGQLYIGGSGLAKGYINHPQLTAEKFVNIEAKGKSIRVYSTGDIVKQTMDGAIDFIGRKDDQVKIAGHRIELGEVCHAILQHTAVKQTYATVSQKIANEKKLIAYVVSTHKTLDANQLRDFLRNSMPNYMIPSEFIFLDQMPLNQNGKVDRKALPSIQVKRQQTPLQNLDTIIKELWQSTLNLENVSDNDNFFDCGGTSLLYMSFITRGKKEYQLDISAVDIFEQPTFGGFKALIKSRNTSIENTKQKYITTNSLPISQNAPIAIIGMSGRFPGADSPESFWTNLVNEVDKITDFEISNLALSEQLIARENDQYVYARGTIDDFDCFDAEFFNISEREAAASDPQQRLFLEECWKALESAGYYPHDNNRIGLFAGSGHNRYYLTNIFPQFGVNGPLGDLPTQFVNDKDYIATRTAFKLNLQGPCLSINTACSTSLVAVVEAVKSLRSNDCEMALAGGVSLQTPMNAGYLYQEDGMLSEDGRTRPFDKNSTGTSFNSGVAIVLLKRLTEAEKDGDFIYAVIHGAASNNDGTDKASFTAPGIKGQTKVINAALNDADFNANSIDFVETHGTATSLGDPIEVEALNRAFNMNNNNNRRQPCWLGSAKSNVGHLVAAAGTAGLIKTCFALNQRFLPAMLHSTAPNPRINFAALPFKICDKSHTFAESGRPLRAGVSSFGVGGTNAHVILQEYKDKSSSVAKCEKQPRLFVLSAKSEQALMQYTDLISSAIENMDEQQLRDTAFTLQKSRAYLPYRYACVTGTAAELKHKMKKVEPPFVKIPPKIRPLVFLFSGQGSQCLGMGKSLYQAFSIYRENFDECAALFQPLIQHDLRQVIFPSTLESDQNDQLLVNTEITQPALFSVEYALAKLWMSLGVTPDLLIGHSIGEYAAAAISGVFSLEDAVTLVTQRSKLMQSMPPGSMLSVKSTQHEINRLLPPEITIAAINAPEFYVVSGKTEEILRFTQILQKENVNFSSLATSHAFHSPMMTAAATAFYPFFSNISFKPPSIPIISTYTGQRIKDEEIQSADYWCQQICNPVLFRDAIEATRQETSTFLEVGPGSALTVLSTASFDNSESVCINSGINGKEQEKELWLKSVGKIWQLGYEINWSKLYDQHNQPRRIPLPTYPFKRARHWIDAPNTVLASNSPIAQELANPVSAIPEQNITFQSIQSLSTEQPMANNMSIKNLVILELKKAFEELTGNQFNDNDDQVSFLELGLDSLLLTQIVLKLKNNYKLSIPFRRLMQDLENFDLLAEYIIDEADPVLLPAALVATESSTEAVSPIPTVGLVANNTVTHNAAANLHQLLAQQLQLISQQLTLLDTTNLTATKLAPSQAQTPVAAKAQPQAKEKKSNTKASKEKPFGAQTKIELAQCKAELTAEQCHFFDNLIERYVNKTAGSKAYTSKYRTILADPRSVSGFTPELKEIVYPIVVKRSKGSRLWDLDGNEYIDTLCGYGSNYFGYSPDFIVDAMKAQLDQGIEIGPQHPLAGEVAELLSELISLERFAFCNTGSEAVLGAIRMARTATGRKKVVIFKGSYHGINDEVIVRPVGKVGSIPAAAGITPEAVSNTIVLDYDEPGSLQIISQHKDEIAAVLVETVQSRNPKLQPQAFLHQLRELTREHEIAFIMDEIITGFRLGAKGAQKYFDVEADIATYGKVIGGGVSIGIIGGASKYLDTLDGGQWQYGDDSAPQVGVTYFAGTFVRNPLALAAAKAVLLNIKNNGDQLATTLAHKTEDFAQDLNLFFKYQQVPLEIEYFSSLMYLKFTQDVPYGDLLFCDMRCNGIHIWYGRPMFFTLAHTDEDIDKIKSTFINSVLEMKKMGFLIPLAADNQDQPSLTSR